MPSISHRTGLSQGALHRAKSGLAALPGGIVRGVVRGLRVWLEIRREVRQLEDHVVHDVGFQVRSGARPDPRHGAGHSDADLRFHAQRTRPMSKLALIALPAGILCGAIRRAIARAASTVISWLKTRRQMRHPEPGDRLLRDVGLTGLNKHAPMLTPHHRSQTNKEC